MELIHRNKPVLIDRWRYPFQMDWVICSAFLQPGSTLVFGTVFTFSHFVSFFYHLFWHFVVVLNLTACSDRDMLSNWTSCRIFANFFVFAQPFLLLLILICAHTHTHTHSLLEKTRLKRLLVGACCHQQKRQFGWGGRRVTVSIHTPGKDAIVGGVESAQQHHLTHTDQPRHAR